MSVMQAPVEAFGRKSTQVNKSMKLQGEVVKIWKYSRA